MEEEYNKELHDYVISIKKHLTGVVLIAAVITLISVLVAFMLPEKYRSSATILIEQQEIPPDLIRSTVTSYAAQSIQIIQARVMSRAKLLEIINKFELYQDDLKLKTTEEVIEMMREDVDLDLKSADVIDPRTGRPSVATIAFSLSYTGESPAQIQRVANELANLYLNENLKNRTQKAEDTSRFFEAEIKRLEETITDLETRLTDFKQKNIELMPESTALKMQTLQRKESEKTAFNTRLFTLREKQSYLNSLLLSLSPASLVEDSPERRLEALQALRTSLIARYSPQHPDVIAVERQIDALTSELGDVQTGTVSAYELNGLREELALALEKYSSDHPDVRRLQGQIAALESDLKSKGERRPEQQYFSSNPSNPVYLSTQAQLADVEIELKTVKQAIATLDDEIEEIESTMVMAPRIEREYIMMMREYQFATAEYEQAKAKQITADAAMQLESEKKGERFTLIDPPQLPEKPISPNRPAILIIGLLLSLAAGIGYAVVIDSVSGTINGSRHLSNIVGAAPLAVIPYQMNFQDVMKKKRFQKRAVIIAVAIVIMAIVILHFVIGPLDVLWYRYLRKFEILLS